MRANILGVEVDNLRAPELLEKVKQLFKEGSHHYLVTPNPEFVIYARRDRYFQKILNSADLSVPDGIGLVWAARMLHQPLEERVAGVDLAELMLKQAAEEGWRVFFLGGRSGVGQKAAVLMSEKFSGLQIVGTFEGEADASGDQEIRRLIKKIKPDLVLIGYGHPKQEYWIERNLTFTPVKVAIGVGGAFDYWSGRVTRAPAWIRAVGLEWLYRLLREPWRARRQLALLLFAWLVLKKSLSSR